jgi:hypothetical protein
VVFGVSESGPKANKGEEIVGLDENGKRLNDWQVGDKTIGSAMNGKGSMLLVESKNGGLLLYENWEKNTKPRSIMKSSGGGVFSPEGDFIAVRAKAGNAPRTKVLSTKGKTLWLLPEEADPGAKISFPFLNRKKCVAWASSGSLGLSEEGKLLWKVELKGAPVKLASSFLEGGLIAASTGGEEGKIYFYDENGKQKGAASFPGGASSLSCSDVGVACAALSNGPEGQRLSFFTEDGKERWAYRVKTHATANAAVLVADHGNAIIGGFEENGQWRLLAWDMNGKPLWSAPLEGGLADFKVSWNGRRIAVLTKDGRIAFFDMTEKK